MATPINLSEDDIQNLRTELNKMFDQLRTDESNFTEFYRNPIKFLQNFKIKALDYLNGFNSLKDRLNTALKHIIDQSGRIVNSCLICKTTVLIIIFGTLGKSALLWNGISSGLNAIKDGLKDYFDKTSTEIERSFNFIDEKLEVITPSHLALQICKNLGYCPDYSY
ncbi:hypothetical protein [Flavobacterium sp. HBTb2-11-1]|uniref:hypothetical protein n=1 Tax=Flavobacterium sp. HBTb2-11-1 TaxID=2692212 RepID=UPI00136A2A06|nr:hypothetical protein [Flavobacterium sp. HBTb2-11-1]MXO03962.1 hypothetical protein [Flavobacterium sp. HBTb2-11-1]